MHSSIVISDDDVNERREGVDRRLKGSMLPSVVAVLASKPTEQLTAALQAKELPI